MSTWPLMWRNKVEDSKVSVPVQRCTESENVVLQKAAQDVSHSGESFPVPHSLKTVAFSSWTNGIYWRLLIGYRSA